ncbi:hypothetical protein [Nocardiopsis coralliicola]
MDPFISGVVSSLVASALVLAASRLAGVRLRTLLAARISHWLGIGALRIYPRQQDAEPDLARDVRRAQWVDVFAGRGNALTREPFAPLQAGGLDSARIILPTANARPGSWLSRRAGELQDSDPGMAADVLSGQVHANATYIDALSRSRESVELRRYDLPHLLRVVATDRSAYLTFYQRGRHGRCSPCLRVARPGLLYDAARSLFSTVWHVSTPTGLP